MGISSTLTHCLMDSTYAVNVLKVDITQLKSAVMNKKEGGYYSLRLDSLNFCGETYRNVMFVVMECSRSSKVSCLISCWATAFCTIALGMSICNDTLSLHAVLIGIMAKSV